MVGDVGLGEINPEADSFGEGLPLFHVPPDRLLAAMNEGLNPVGFDFGFGVNAEALADLDLNGQAMGIPAGLPLAIVAPHRPIAGVEVLDRPGQAVARMRHAVGSGWPLKKDEPAGPLAVGEGFLVDAGFLPEGGDVSFSGGQVRPAANGLKHGGGDRKMSLRRLAHSGRKI